jgi:hypothetical protein
MNAATTPQDGSKIMATLPKLALLRLGSWIIDWIDRLIKHQSAKGKGTAARQAASHQPPAANAQRYDSSRNIERRPPATASRVAAKVLVVTAKAEDKVLSAQGLRRRLRDPRSLRQALVLSEILSKPLALRQRRRGGR